MKKCLFIILLFSIVSISYAQDAKAILSKASEAYQNAGGITANFTLESEDISKKTTFSQDGKAAMKGNMFKLEMVDATTWFDGKTQYVYMKDAEEVNITTPDEKELASISPLVIFNMYKQGFDLKYKGEKKLNDKTVLEVELTPQQKGKELDDIEKISIFVDKVTNIFAKLVIADKSGLTNSIVIKNMQTKVDLVDSSFRFDKVNYPNAEVIDLR